MDRAALDAALLQAHAAGDKPALVRLYTEAADRAAAAGDARAAGFFRTHAFVFALEAGLPEAHSLNAQLVAEGRAHPI